MLVRLGTFKRVDAYLVTAVTNHTYCDLFLSHEELDKWELFT